MHDPKEEHVDQEDIDHEADEPTDDPVQLTPEELAVWEGKDPRDG